MKALGSRRGGKTRALLVAAALPLLMASKCDEPLVQDSGFDIWCGADLCNWTLEAGQIRPAPTWHDRDLGVELVGEDVRLSQTLAHGNHDLDCLRFNLLADIADRVTVTLEVHFDDGGMPEHSEKLTNGAWTPITYRFTTPTYFRSLRLVLHKTGAGRAVLAQIQALSSSDCSDPPPTGPLDRPAGATCEEPVQCMTGTLCRPRGVLEQAAPDPTTPARSVCEACESDLDCPAPSVCGVAFTPGIDEPFAACVPAAAASLGERCRGDSACESGLCCEGACSTCCASTAAAGACAPGDACASSVRDLFGRPRRVAWQCAPRAGHAAPGARCLTDEDCAEGHCTGSGPLSVCAADGRRCASDLDCLPAERNSCIALGVAGGRCQ